MASQDRFRRFLDNIEPSSTKTSAQKARTGSCYFLRGREVTLGVRT
jgi:hypothetical protein